jgi:Ca2+:H+ antiporter
MRKITPFISKNPLLLIFLAFPVLLLAMVFNWGPTWILSLSALMIVPLAGLIGKATEVLAEHTGPRIGGLLNATLGNAAELIITLVAIRAGLVELVKASITGSILGNLLLVLGFAMVCGGLKNGTQSFDRKSVGNHSALLVLAVVALVIPSFFGQSIQVHPETKQEFLSLGVAGIMIVLYILGLIFTLKNRTSPITYPGEKTQIYGMSIRNAILLLLFATSGIAWMSELLVGAVESATTSLGLSEFFLGIILIPIIGNVAEHLVAVQVAIRNKMDLSVEIAVSSSLQIALFVAPLLVFVSLIFGKPLTLLFNPFELLALGTAVVVAVMVSADGESNWLEGAALLAVYLILSLAFFFL